MKRALAERANKTTASATSTAPATATATKGIPSSSVATPILTSSSNSPTTTCNVCPMCLTRQRDGLIDSPSTSNSSSRSSKKLKLETIKMGDENDNNNTFYLKHQNKALYSQYLILRESLSSYEKEQSDRRQQVDEAIQTLLEIELVWKRVVFDLYGWLDCILNELAPDTCHQEPISIDTTPPPKFLTKHTAADYEFENTTYLYQILQQFIHTLPPTTNSSHSGRHSSFTESCHLLFYQMAHFSSLLSSGAQPTQDQQQQATTASLKQQLEKCHLQKQELIQSRNVAIQQSIKIKKWFFRFLAGTCTVEHARSALESEDYSLDRTVLEQELLVEDEKKENGKDESQKVEELEVKISCRDQRIEELLKQLEQQAVELTTKKQKEGNSSTSTSHTSEEFLQLATQLSTAKKEVEQHHKIIDQLKQQCSIEKANTLLYQRQIQEIQDKYEKKIQELIDSPSKTDEEIVKLDHKYAQALEELKQLELLKSNMRETRKMNDYHQHKMEEYKSKYISATQNKSHLKREDSAVSNDSNANVSTTNNSSSSNVSYDKLKLDFRKVRKELAAANNSKENYKNKLEKIDKERDNLLKANARLLKQNAEKDEVNTKSLSTILHLKQVFEKQKEEKEQLEQCRKSAEQLALAARLSCKAKERLHVDLDEEKKKIRNDYKLLEKDKNSLELHNEEQKVKIDTLNTKLTEYQEQTSTLQKQFQTATSQNKKIQEEKYSLLEKLSISKTEKNSSAPATQTVSSTDPSNCHFSADQLKTQVDVLKGRLSCPVCNYRDKNCILLRCRHMFCRHCVEENIKNRSRKCPACGQRFDTKDVADVWL